MNEQQDRNFLKIGSPLCGVLCGIAGALLALMLLFIGFWRTLFVALLFAVGYFLGASADKADSVRRFINRCFPPKDE